MGLSLLGLQGILSMYSDTAQTCHQHCSCWALHVYNPSIWEAEDLKTVITDIKYKTKPKCVQCENPCLEILVMHVRKHNGTGALAEQLSAHTAPAGDPITDGSQTTGTLAPEELVIKNKICLPNSLFIFSFTLLIFGYVCCMDLYIHLCI